MVKDNSSSKMSLPSLELLPYAFNITHLKKDSSLQRIEHSMRNCHNYVKRTCDLLKEQT